MKFLMVEVVVNKKIILGGLVGIFAVIAFSVVFVSPGAFAGEGGSTGDGGVNGCRQDYGYWTCYGATWRYYTTNSDSVYIEGYTDNDHAYAAAGYVEGCAKYGGYWRYAMVEVVGNHKQYGLIGIGGNNSAYLSNTYNSQFFGGGMQYIPPTPGDGLNANNAHWSYVEGLYKDLQRRFPSEFTSGWNKNSNLAWFCGPDNIDKLDVKLTGVPVDTSGNELPKTTLTGTGGDGGAVVWEKSTTPGGSATIGAGLDSNSTYFFIGWYDSKLGGTRIGENRRYTEKITSSKTVYAVYERRYLEVKGKNIHDNSDIADGNSTKRTENNGGWVNMERKNLNNSTYDYHFIGWKKSSSAGLDNILEDTDTSKDIYVSDGGKYKYNNSSKNIYLKINANVANGNKTVYAYYTPSCELRIDRGEGATITIERTSSKYGNQHSAETWSGDNDPTPWTLYKDDELKVTFGAKSGYNLSGAYISGIPVKSGVSYTVPGDSSGVCDVTVSVDAKKNEFEGRSRVGGDMSVSTGWTKTSDTKTYVIDNCDPLNGCEVKFDHSLRRTGGVGSVNYSITRTYFGDDTENLKSNQSIDPGDETIVRSQNDSRIILRPGQVVCEEMKFKSNAAGSDTVLKVCAVASGSAQGDAQLLLDMKISKEKDKNGEYINYTDEIYVKPGDDIRYRAVYHPVLQYAYGIKPQKIEINGDLFNNPANSEHGCMLSNYYDLGGFFGNCQKDFWKNAFTMYSKMNPSSRSVYAEKDYEYSAGDTSEQREFRDKKVGNDDVGNELIGYAEINKNNNIRATPTSITFSYKDGYSVATVNVDRINKTAKAVVPYNFTNSIEIATDGNIVYAGETAKITSTVAVNPKTNSLTTDGSEAQKYATKVPEAKVKLKLRYGNGEEYEIEKTKTNFSNSALYDMTVNIKDFPAGTTIKAQACVYPASSGADGNWQDKEGSHDWACSAEKEYIVAKRPSFQVWGGGVYSNGGITAPSSIKNNLDGVYVYNVNSSSGTTVFGSWAEQAVVSNGAVNGLASGAATGLNITLNGMLVNGGITTKPSTDFCDNRVPLSFANYLSGGGGCPYSPQTGQLGAANNVLDRRALINYIIGDTGAEVIKLQSSDGNYILDNRSEYGGDTVKQGVTRVVVAASTNEDGNSGAIVPGTITIVDDKYYESYDEPHHYSTLTEIPKLIIYAENINIACNVTRLDAILIAENTITTCPSTKKDKEGNLIPLNEVGNSTPLTVNGIIIANKLELNRTYGAATGVNSGVPAEIVNHDSSTVLWSMSQVDTDDYSGLSIIYQHELAPRY